MPTAPDLLTGMDVGTAGALAVAAAAVAVLSLLMTIGTQLRLARLRRGLRLLRGHAGEGDVLEVLTRQTAQVALLHEQLERQRAELDRARADVAASLRHVAVVRYDAFGDQAGRLSFSAVVLDDAGDGLVLTSIHGRGETRSYAKGVSGGASELPLSPEEQQAMTAATASEPVQGSAKGVAAGRS